MIKVKLNDEEVALDQGGTIESLLKQVAMGDAERIAIAVNDTVVRRDNWSSHQLSDNDQVLMIAPIQGG